MKSQKLPERKNRPGSFFRYAVLSQKSKVKGIISESFWLT